MKNNILLFIAVLLALSLNSCQTAVTPDETTETEIVQPVVEEEKGMKIWAGFDTPSTKTGLVVDDSQTTARVVWKSADSFNVYSFLSDNRWYTSSPVFTTTAKDVTSAEFTSPDTVIESDFYGAIYPSGGTAINLQIEDDPSSHISLVSCIPSEQTAVAGSFEPAANPMVAYAATIEDMQQLRFKNVVSLLKIRVAGEGVSSLSSIRVSCGGAEIAGSRAAIFDFDSEPKVAFLDNGTKSTTVSLNGVFASNTDYYIAIKPGTYSGVSITFLYSDGNIMTRSIRQSVTFGRAQIRNLGTFELTAGGNPDVVKYKISEKTKPVNLCVLSEGFTADQRESFENLAKSGIDFLFSVDPYKSLSEYFNVYLMWAPSQDAGASITDGNGTVTTARNTAFGAKWGESSYDAMIADSEAVFDFVSTRCPEIVRGEATIAEVPVLLIINDSRNGGRAISYSNGQTYCLVPYTDNGGTLSWGFPNIAPTTDEPVTNPQSQYYWVTDQDRAEMGISTGNWHNTLLHEFGGHSIGRLADEYWKDDRLSYPSGQGSVERHSWAVPFGLNVSGYYTTVPWQDLLDMQSSLVLNNVLYGRIGKYQGGEVYIFNRWRSEKISCMIDNRAYFSAWQRVLIAKRIVELAGETFSLSGYMAIDNPVDPIRDAAPSSNPTASMRGVIPVMPPLAPPLLIDQL